MCKFFAKVAADVFASYVTKTGKGTLYTISIKIISNMKNIKKLFATVVITGLLLGNTLVASAQTATTTSAGSLQVLIQTLQEQIKALTAQLEEVKKAQQQVATTGSDIKDTLRLINQLREGASGDDVKLLQTILAVDLTVYPEGRVTGYYGKLTTQAVKRFQKMHNIDQAGNVGPKTIEKITKELEKNPIGTEVRDGKKALCAIVPPGHLIAPGWLKKTGGNAPIVPVCQILPAGIAKQLELATSTAPTTTIDVIAPIVSNIGIRNIAFDSARIEWKTNEAATSMVWYGTSTLATTSTASVINAAILTQNHSITLAGLAANTVYYIMVGSADAANNIGKSAQYSFVTMSLPDATAPVMTGITATSSHVVWTTNEPATGGIWYATSTPVVTTGPQMASEATFAINHDLPIDNLAANTMYYYIASSVDAAGNRATSTEATFQTGAF